MCAEVRYGAHTHTHIHTHTAARAHTHTHSQTAHTHTVCRNLDDDRFADVWENMATLLRDEDQQASTTTSSLATSLSIFSSLLPSIISCIYTTRARARAHTHTHTQIRSGTEEGIITACSYLQHHHLTSVMLPAIRKLTG